MCIRDSVNYARVNAGKTALNDLSDTAYFRAEDVKVQIAAIADTVTLEDQESIAAVSYTHLRK